MRFFISSTYQDLHEYRQFAIEYFKDLTGNSTGDISAMEFFAASEESCIEVCLNELEKSDILIGIYGSKYGSIDHETGLSMTEREFDYAASHGKPILAFVSRDQKEQRQEAFIHDKVFALEKSCARYDTKEDFANRLNESMKEYFKGLEGFSFSSLWDDLQTIKEEANAELQEGTPRIEVYDVGEEESAINDLLEYSQVLNNIYEYISDIYSLLANSDLTDEKVDKAVALLEEKWEFFNIGLPNMAINIERNALFLKVIFLQRKLLTSIWTDELRQEIIGARDAYIKRVDHRYCYD